MCCMIVHTTNNRVSVSKNNTVSVSKVVIKSTVVYQWLITETPKWMFVYQNVALNYGHGNADPSDITLPSHIIIQVLKLKRVAMTTANTVLPKTTLPSFYRPPFKISRKPSLAIQEPVLE